MVHVHVNCSSYFNFTMTGHLYKSTVDFLFSFNGTCYQLVFVSSNIIFCIFTMTVYLCCFLCLLIVYVIKKFVFICFQLFFHNFIVTGQSAFVIIRYIWIQLFYDTMVGSSKMLLLPENCEEVIIIH